MSRLILEMGMGNDLYGQDYTKAACRAVQDAIHHSSLTLFSSLELDHAKMQVKVTIGVQVPEAVDRKVVAAELPRGVAEALAWWLMPRLKLFTRYRRENGNSLALNRRQS